MWRLLYIGFLAAHGFVHVAVWTMPKTANDKNAPFDPGYSWLFGSARQIAVVLAVIAGTLFMVGAGGAFAQLGWWRAVVVIASIVSIGLMTLYFNPWLIAGWVLSAGLIAGIVWLAWPSDALVGA
jgi:hypothetical protein